MKKIIKFSLKLLLLIFVTSLLYTLYIVYIYETSFEKVVSKESQDFIYTEFEKMEELPESFYKTLEKYYPNYFETSVWESLYKGVPYVLFINKYTNREKYICSCRDLHFGYYFSNANREILKSNIKFPSIVIALELEEKFSQKKCYTFDITHSYFGNNLRGVKDAAKFYYNKNLEELSEREILELNIIKDAPTMYEPLKNSIRLDKKVDKLMKE